MSKDDDDDGVRILFFEMDGETFPARDCHDIDEIEQNVGFTYCPICGGRRKYHDGKGYLDHDQNYNPNRRLH